jgi:hypothetical protein
MSANDPLGELLLLEERRRRVGPGPEERRLGNRMRFRLLGTWSGCVVRERLRRDAEIMRGLRNELDDIANRIEQQRTALR